MINFYIHRKGWIILMIFLEVQVTLSINLRFSKYFP